MTDLVSKDSGQDGGGIVSVGVFVEGPRPIVVRAHRRAKLHRRAFFISLSLFLSNLSRPNLTTPRSTRPPHPSRTLYIASAISASISFPCSVKSISDYTPRTAQTGSMAPSRTRNLDSDGPSTADVSTNEDVEMQDQSGPTNGFQKFSVRAHFPTRTREPR